MEKEFIGYSEALALKELGFDEDCLYDYFAFNNLNQTLEDDIKPMLTQEDVDNYCVENKLYPFWSCLAPLYQQAFRWFREKYNLDGSMSVDVWNKKTTSYRISGGIVGVVEASSYGDLYDIDSKNYDTYKEAELECLKKLIEIVKDQKL